MNDSTPIPSAILLRDAASEAFGTFLESSREYSHADAKFVAGLMLLSDFGLERARGQITDANDLADAEAALRPGNLLMRAANIYLRIRAEDLKRELGREPTRAEQD